MKKLTLKDLAKMSNEKNVPLLGDQDKLSAFPFMTGYLEDFELFDEDLGDTRGFYFPLYNLEEGRTEDEVLEHFRKRSAFVIKKHKKEIEFFKKIDESDFNPIENYDRLEEWTKKKTGTDTLRDAIDAVKMTSVYGEKNDTENLGAVQNTENYGVQSMQSTTGAQTNTNSLGERTVDTTEKTYAYDSNDFVNKAKQTVTEGAQENSQTMGSRSDSVNVDAHIDTHSEQARENSFTSGEHTDTQRTDFREDVHEQTYDNTETFNTHVHGNIGVTTATAMLTEAEEFYSRWNFYNKLFDLVLSELAYYSDSGVDIMGRRRLYEGYFV